MAALNTVQKMVTAARELLQDATVPYRYSDDSLVLALSIACSESLRIRPDLWIGDNNTPPEFTTVDDTSVSPYISNIYRPAFLYFMVGYVQLRDEEDTQDPRALGLMAKFQQQLLGL